MLRIPPSTHTHLLFGLDMILNAFPFRLCPHPFFLALLSVVSVVSFNDGTISS